MNHTEGAGDGNTKGREKTQYSFIQEWVLGHVGLQPIEDSLRDCVKHASRVAWTERLGCRLNFTDWGFLLGCWTPGTAHIPVCVEQAAWLGRSFQAEKQREVGTWSGKLSTGTKNICSGYGWTQRWAEDVWDGTETAPATTSWVVKRGVRVAPNKDSEGH